MMLCWFNNALGAYSENYSDSAAGRCQKLQTVGRHQPVLLPWWEYWVSEFWAVVNVSEISCDPQQRSVLVYWYTSSKTGYVSTQQSTAFLEEVFGRSFLAGVPHGGVRFFQQVLIWTHYACTNMTPVHVIQRNANLVAERQLVIPRVKPEKPTSSE